jgi:hypothetical protein
MQTGRAENGLDATSDLIEVSAATRVRMTSAARAAKKGLIRFSFLGIAAALIGSSSCSSSDAGPTSSSGSTSSTGGTGASGAGGAAGATSGSAAGGAAGSSIAGAAGAGGAGMGGGGAAIADAGPSDAPDAGVADTGEQLDARSAPCPAGALLCEDFDKYASAADLATTWRITATAATLTVDATKPFGTSGKALHVMAPAGTPTAVILKEGAPLFPILGNAMYGRVMMWLNQTPAGNYHWNNFQSSGTIPGGARNAKYGWGGQNGKVLAGYTVRETAAGAPVIDCSKPSATGLPEKRWVCVEWKFDGVGNEMHYWFDGALLADVDVVRTGDRCFMGTVGDTWSAPTFANLSIGWQQYQASTGALEFWMDDLAVGTGPLGCPAP